MDQPEIPYESIDNYLLGRMDSDAAAAFESEIASNPDLGNEVSFQRSVISGVQEARKLQLKSRLSEIPVSASPLVGALQSTWLKATTGIIVAGSLSLAAYYQLVSDQSATEIVENYVTITAPVEADEVATVQLPEKIEVEEAPSERSRQTVVSKIEKGVEEKAEELPGVAIPDVSVPQPVNPGNNDTFDEEEPDLITESLTTEASSSPVTIEVVQSLESRSYRYFDGVLGLKGDFEDITYDILEINDKEGRRLFLLIDGAYYGLTSTESYKPLVKIDNKKLSKQLDVLRDYK